MPEQVGVFISHHHSPEENGFTARLKADLRAAGADVWVDDDNITSDNFLEKINEGLAGRQWVVFVMTPESLHSVWVKDEINAALTQVRKGRMRGVIPIMAQPCSEDDIPVLWDSLHRYDATTDYPSALAGLLRAMGLPAPASTQSAQPQYPAQQPQWSPSAQPAQPTPQTPQPQYPAQQPQWGAPAQPTQQPQWPSPAMQAPGIPAGYNLPAYNTPAPMPQAPAIPTPGAGASVWYVDASGKNGVRTIKEALSKAQSGDQVLVLPGKYQEHVTISKSVELIGYGRREAIVLEAAGGALFRAGVIVSTAPQARVANLTVKQQKFIGPGGISVEGGELEVAQCDVTTANGAGVICKNASVTIRGTRIHDCPMQGLIVEGAGATALMEESTISACAKTSGAALWLKGGARATVRRNRIADNFRFAIQIEAGCGGTFEDNDLRGNKKGVWETDPSGMAEVSRERNLE